MAKAQYASRQVLNIYRGHAPSVPAQFYVGLLTTLPTKNDGTGLVEVSSAGTGYARQPLAAADASWSAPATQGDNLTEQIGNTPAVTFPTPTAPWGTVVGVGVFDALTGGNLWDYGALAASQAITSTAYTLPAGALTLGEK